MTTKPEPDGRILLAIVAPDDPCQSVLCSRIDGRCVGSHCGRCGAPSSHQGHYTSMCSNVDGPTEHHFCCPNDCELRPGAKVPRD